MVEAIVMPRCRRRAMQFRFPRLCAIVRVARRYRRVIRDANAATPSAPYARCPASQCRSR